VIHGDPHIENVLVVDGSVKWIDFRQSDSATTKTAMSRDVFILYRSLNPQSSLTSAEAVEICAYSNDPSVRNLLAALTRVYT
jgi:tRNA A-37 threonylcarbamoyl transferase component Bud32